MGSWVECRCGQQIGTGSFPNDHVYRLVSEGAYDQIEDPVDRRALERFFLAGESTIRCPRCARLIMLRKGASPEYYVREEGST
jgi:hypothetical protein